MGSSKVDTSREILPCVFLDDVLCSYRKTEKVKVMNRCWKCEHYKRFLREMEEEDARDMEEIDFIHKYGYEMYDSFYKKRKGGGGV